MVRFFFPSFCEVYRLILYSQSYKEQSDKLAGPIGLLKQFITRTARETAEDATQIFGGRGITATGMGRYIENVRFLPKSIGLSNVAHFDLPPVKYHRGSPFDAILGGAEDVLGDLGVRQAMRKMPPTVRL